MKICSIFWEVQVGFERLLSREGIPVNSLPTAWDPHRPLELWEHELYFALTGSKQLPKNEIKSHDAFVFCLSSLFFSLSTLHKLNCDYLKIKIITQINLAVYQWRKVTCFFLCFSLPHLKGTGQRVLWHSILMSQTEGPGPRKEVRDILLVTGQSQLDGMVCTASLTMSWPHRKCFSMLLLLNFSFLVVLILLKVHEKDVCVQ